MDSGSISQEVNASKRISDTSINKETFFILFFSFFDFFMVILPIVFTATNYNILFLKLPYFFIIILNFIKNDDVVYIFLCTLHARNSIQWKKQKKSKRGRENSCMLALKNDDSDIKDRG